MIRPVKCWRRSRGLVMFKRLVPPLIFVLLLTVCSVAIHAQQKRRIPRVVTVSELAMPATTDCSTLTNQEVGALCFDTDADPDSDGTVEGQIFAYTGSAFVAIVTGEGTSVPSELDVNGDGTADISWDGTNMIIAPLGGVSTPIKMGDQDGVTFGAGISTIDIATSNDGTYDHGIRVAAAANSAELIHGYNTDGEHVFKLNTDELKGGFFQLLGDNEDALFEMDTEPSFYAAFGSDDPLPGDPTVSIYGDLALQDGIDLDADGTINFHMGTDYLYFDADGDSTEDVRFYASGIDDDLDGTVDTTWSALGSGTSFMHVMFEETNTAASQTDSLTLILGSQSDQWRPGRAVTLTSLWCSADNQVPGAGTATFLVTNGASDTDLTVSFTSAEVYEADTTCTSNCSVTANGIIALELDTDASWDGTNVDFTCNIGMTF